jgi:hypothetical protein
MTLDRLRHANIPIEIVSLAPLQLTTTHRIIADTLVRDDAEVGELAEVIQRAR